MNKVRDLLFLQTHRGAFRACRPEDIITIHVDDHVCRVTLVGEKSSIVLVKSSLQDLLDVLPVDMFCRIAKDTAVNVFHVLKLDGSQLFLSDEHTEEFSPRSNYKQSFFDKFMVFPDSNS